MKSALGSSNSKLVRTHREDLMAESFEGETGGKLDNRGSPRKSVQRGMRPVPCEVQKSSNIIIIISKVARSNEELSLAKEVIHMHAGSIKNIGYNQTLICEHNRGK